MYNQQKKCPMAEVQTDNWRQENYNIMCDDLKDNEKNAPFLFHL